MELHHSEKSKNSEVVPVTVILAITCVSRNSNRVPFVRRILKTKEGHTSPTLHVVGFEHEVHFSSPTSFFCHLEQTSVVW